jgi:hypothetical protein
MRIEGYSSLSFHYTKDLSEAEKREVEKLRQRDSHVRAHEQAHLSAGAGLTTGGAKFKYQTGPDGRQYAVGGEVGLRIPEGGDPETRLRNALRVERAALAPSDPSPQDRAVAGKAREKANDAREELTEESVEKMKQSGKSEVIKVKDDSIAEERKRWYNKVDIQNSEPPQKEKGRNLDYIV